MTPEDTVRGADLAREVASLREQRRAISDVLNKVAGSEGLQAVLDEVVRAATDLCDGENGRLWLFTDGLLHAFANHGLPETYEYDRRHPHEPGRTSLAGRTALTRAVVHIPDIDADLEYAYEGPRPWSAGLGVPILTDDGLIGVINITRSAPKPFADDQIELVRTFADQAAIAIANTRLIEAVERQRTELSRFVSPQIAALVSSAEGERLLAGHRAYISVLFCDLRRFTAFVETAEPEELFDVLRDYHAMIGELLPAHEGTLEHFAGDGVMVFFNDPAAVERHEAKAVAMGLALHRRFEAVSSVWRKRGTDLGLGIGIAAGYATLGRIGFEGRYDYGALGSVTNLASRLSTNAPAGETLIDQRLFAAVEGDVDVEPAGELELKGFGRPVAAYRVRALRSS